MRIDLVFNCIKGYFLISVILWGCTGLVYRVNSKLKPDDPSRKDMHPAAIFLTPLWPVYIVFGAIIFILRATLYVFGLILFTIGLVFIRKPFILIWLSKIASKLGNKLMKINMFLFRMVFPQQKPQATQ